LGISKAYATLAERDGLVPDAAQLHIVTLLQSLQSQLEARPTGVARLLARFGIGAMSPVRGMYLWGGVGRGKTFLMDLFFDTLQVDAKRRVHFHRMMNEIHERLKTVADTEDPLQRVAAAIARDTRVLCFDEFYVSDIGDAMVLGRLLDALFGRGMTLVATSNLPPDELYRHGLQRERFMPAIDLLKRYTRVVELAGSTDYRLRLMERAGTFLTPLNDTTDAALMRIFRDIAPGETVEARTLDVLGRDVRTRHCGKGVAWFDFDDICDGPRSQNDYVEIARRYQAVIVSGVPVMRHGAEDQARRFIAMVDEFYDRRVKLVVSAAAEARCLYQGTKLAFEFRRTASRLQEMQTADYLHQPHIA
jgi:cell division protein ZapE